MKQMTITEMDGFLKGKCIPRDLKVNETNAEYLVSKFAELESKLETALRECRSAGITIDNLEAKCAALSVQVELSIAAERAWERTMMCACGEDGPKSVADKFYELKTKCAELAVENAWLKKFCKEAAFDADYEAELGMERGGFSDALNEIKTPATDAFLAEVRAQGVEMLNTQFKKCTGMLYADSVVSTAEYFAAQLRKGGNQ